MIRAVKIFTITISCIFVFFSFSFSQDKAEQLTITTYYPSPYGSYNELQLYPHDTPVTKCDPEHPEAAGTMYFHSEAGPPAKKEIRVCNGVSWIAVEKIGTAGSYWTMVGSKDIHNTDLGNVAIGTPARSDAARLTVYRNTVGQLANFVGKGHSSGDPATRIMLQDLDSAVDWFMSAYDDGRFTIHQGGVGDRLAITSSGSVGIGTDSPDQTARLTINKDSLAAAVKIVDGNQKAGYVLTSDDEGVGKWSSNITAAASGTLCGFVATS